MLRVPIASLALLFTIHSATFGVEPVLEEFASLGAAMGNGGMEGNLTWGSDGKLYGASLRGGAARNGAVFSVNAQGDVSILVEFTAFFHPARGAEPRGGLVEGPDGAFYGTTLYGNTDGLVNYGSGGIFRITKSGAYTELAAFTDGVGPNLGRIANGHLAFGRDGRLYGTTLRAGNEIEGTIFSCSLTGEFRTLAQFPVAGDIDSPQSPNSGFIRGADGSLYGTMKSGGRGRLGALYRYEPGFGFTTLLSFSTSTGFTDSSTPFPGLAIGLDGHIHGTTQFSANQGGPHIYRWRADSGYERLVPAAPSGTIYRPGGLTLGRDGHIYGMDYGRYIRIAPDGTLTLHPTPFSADENTGWALGGDGHLYTSGNGKVWRLNFGPTDPTQDLDNDRLPDSWEIQHWQSVIGRGPYEDDEGDGVTNLEEYAFGLNPRRTDAAAAPAPVLENGFLTITVAKRPGVTFTAESGANPGNLLNANTVVLIDDVATLKVRDKVAITSADQRFLQLRVTAN